MIFHSIDNKQNCKTVFSQNELILDPDYNNFTGTWDYNLDHHNPDIQYAKLYLKGKSLNDVCPSDLKEEWEAVKERHGAFIKSFKSAKVKATDYCFYDLVPEDFLLHYFSQKCKIVDYILNNYAKPTNYEFLFELSKLLSEIEGAPLIFNYSALTPILHKYKARRFKEKLSKLNPFISYNIFGTVTGRLTTKKNSFPILTLDKDYRSILEPTNDWFVELDFNAAELRCLLALNEVPQPEEDIHKWHHAEISHIYKQDMDRNAIKRKIFSWLYGGPEVSLGMPKIEKYYNKQRVVEKYWDGTKIINPFGKEIECDKFRALNFLIQSTTSDLFLRRAIEVNKLLHGRKTKITALIHDSMLLDFSEEDKEILPALISTFEKTDLGNFRVNKKIGLDFGNMKEF